METTTTYSSSSKQGPTTATATRTLRNIITTDNFSVRGYTQQYSSTTAVVVVPIGFVLEIIRQKKMACLLFVVVACLPPESGGLCDKKFLPCVSTFWHVDTAVLSAR